MPNMASVTVKKNDGTTDIVYNNINPAGGDESAALWRAEAAATVGAFKPRAEMRSRWTADKKSRHVQVHFVMPVTQTDTGSGITSLIGQIPVNYTIVLPQTFADSAIAEAVSQCNNLLNSTLFKDCLKAGFAPN